MSRNMETASAGGRDSATQPDTPEQMFRYELPLGAGGAASAEAGAGRIPAGVPRPLLLQSILWFCRLRWVVTVGLAAFGVVCWPDNLLPRIGLKSHPHWPFVAAAVLAVANTVFLVHARRHERRSATVRLELNLWAQIAVDLLVLTVVVHYMGSLETYVAFAYLFHIVLVCIFFPRLRSFAVAAMACCLYAACVILEETGVVPPASIYADDALRQLIARIPGAWALNLVWAMVTWILVWYMASRLSAMVRRRDSELARTNRRLVEAQEEKARHIVRTTHELKAPFAAIDANAQLLLKGHCGPISGRARSVVLRIVARSERLARQIQEMLQMADLGSGSPGSRVRTELDLAEVLRWCIGQIRPVAEEREVVLVQDLQAARAVAAEDHMKMLFSNLLSNAVVYCHRGGRVEVRCVQPPDGCPTVTVADSGIGISPEKLPHVFDPYYRAEEAVRHHGESTGLGLTIVRHIAEAYGIRVRVESAPGVGTAFTLRFEGTAEHDEYPAEGDRRWRIL